MPHHRINTVQHGLSFLRGELEGIRQRMVWGLIECLMKREDGGDATNVLSEGQLDRSADTPVRFLILLERSADTLVRLLVLRGFAA